VDSVRNYDVIGFNSEIRKVVLGVQNVQNNQ